MGSSWDKILKMEKAAQLTVAQALAEGYTHFVYGNDGFQRVKQIEPEEIDWKRDDISIVEKEGFHPTGIDEDNLKDMIIDHIWQQHYDDTNDDDDNVIEEAIRPLNLDLSNVIKQIDEALTSITTYKSAGIKLIP